MVIGVKQASEHAFDANVNNKEILNITSNDTLHVKMNTNDAYKNNAYRSGNSVRLVYNDNDEKIIYSSDIRLIVRSTKDSLASLRIEKSAEGSSYQQAKVRANNINYNYALNGNELLLDAFLTTAYENKFSDQEVELILYLPEGTTLYADDNTYSFHRNSSYHDDILDNGMEEHYLKIMHNEIMCSDCPDEDYEFKVNINDDDSRIRINDEGLEINTNDSSLKINEEGVNAESETVRVNINENGINITSEENNTVE
jgi:hypothetical protein